MRFSIVEEIKLIINLKKNNILSLSVDSSMNFFCCLFISVFIFFSSYNLVFLYLNTWQIHLIHAILSWEFGFGLRLFTGPEFMSIFQTNYIMLNIGKSSFHLLSKRLNWLFHLVFNFPNLKLFNAFFTIIIINC